MVENILQFIGEYASYTVTLIFFASLLSFTFFAVPELKRLRLARRRKIRRRKLDQRRVEEGKKPLGKDAQERLKQIREKA